jgi:hypothetical protein
VADDARVIDGRLYTMRPTSSSRHVASRLRWACYCDGDRIGFFRTKPEAWRAAETHALVNRNEQCMASLEAEQRGCVEGAAILDEFRRWAAGIPKRRRD